MDYKTVHMEIKEQSCSKITNNNEHIFKGKYIKYPKLVIDIVVDMKSKVYKGRKFNFLYKVYEETTINKERFIMRLECKNGIPILKTLHKGPEGTVIKTPAKYKLLDIEGTLKISIDEDTFEFPEIDYISEKWGIKSDSEDHQ